jgi:hypothetical protein
MPELPSSFCRTFADPGFDLQRPADAAVIMVTILRPSIAEALASVFAQDLQGRIHVVIGIDKPLAENLPLLEKICGRHPPNCAVTVLYPGYSTSVRHGGMHPSMDGGVLRTALSYLANGARLAYLDDDNWWHPSHLRTLLAAMSGRQWAWSKRWYVDPEMRQPICVDDWESIGPGKGYFQKIGGWVDPNCLMIDKLACEPILRFWSLPLPGIPAGYLADRHVFHYLHTNFKGAPSGGASAYYTLNARDGMHPIRQTWIQTRPGELTGAALYQPPAAAR